jgi:hypothetical protein
LESKGRTEIVLESDGNGGVHIPSSPSPSTFHRLMLYYSILIICIQTKKINHQNI